jgi:hypothetical protein
MSRAKSRTQRTILVRPGRGEARFSRRCNTRRQPMAWHSARGHLKTFNHMLHLAASKHPDATRCHAVLSFPQRQAWPVFVFSGFVIRTDCAKKKRIDPFYSVDQCNLQCCCRLLDDDLWTDSIRTVQIRQLPSEMSKRNAALHGQVPSSLKATALGPGELSARQVTPPLRFAPDAIDTPRVAV